MFIRIELVCCGMLVVSLIGQAFLIDLHDPAVVVPILLRGALLIAAGLVVLYDWQYVWPRMWRYRQEFLDHADEPEQANPAKDQFDRYQRESVTLLEILLFLLLGMVLFSGGASVIPAGHPVVPQQPDHQPAALISSERGDARC